MLFNAVVARPVGRKETEATPDAVTARDKEWNTLRSRGVWDESIIRHWDDVAREAKAKNKDINFG